MKGTTFIRESELEPFRLRILSWYRQHGRRFPWRSKSSTCYKMIMAEVLLQRTQAGVVAAFFLGFIRRFPSWAKLAEASEEDFKNYLQPIGLWRRRAVSLKKLSDEMAKRKGKFPKTREEIEKLPGIGQYIASAVLLFCHGQPQPLLDVNMARVLERYFGPRKLADIRYDPYLQSLSKALVQCDDPISLNWAILDLATLICKQKIPKHEICPLVANCKFTK